MVGMDFNCDTCDFEMSSGNSHHVGAFFCVCLACGDCLGIGTGESFGGAEREGENLNVLWFRYGAGCKQDEWVNTGVKITVRCGPPIHVPAEVGGPAMEWWAPDTSDIVCPGCGVRGQVVTELHEGDTCPKCRQGRIKASGPVIY